MRDDDQFSRDVADSQCDVFRLFVGKGRRISYAALAAATRIPEGTLKTYANGTAIPLHNLCRLLRVLPRDAGNMLIAQSGMSLTDSAEPNTDWLALGEKAGDFATKVIRYQRSGGVIDHVEAADLRTNLREMFADGAGAMREAD